MRRGTCDRSDQPEDPKQGRANDAAEMEFGEHFSRRIHDRQLVGATVPETQPRMRDRP